MKRSLPQVIKQSINDINNGQNSYEKRKNNIIIYRAIEECDESKRPETDKKLVQDLLKELKIQTSPVKIYRLGKINSESDDPRPIKVELENDNVQKEIMKKAKNLKDAPENLKVLSISYDLTKDQRMQVKGLVNEAKQKTKNDKEFYYKVVGEPGCMTIVQFKKNSD